MFTPSHPWSLIAVCLGLMLAPLASADVYKSVDANGRTVYTDRPATDAKKVATPKGGNVAKSAAPSSAPNAGGEGEVAPATRAAPAG